MQATIYQETRPRDQAPRTRWRNEMEDELPDGDAHGELHGYQLLIAERVAAARLGGTVRMGDVIE